MKHAVLALAMFCSACTTCSTSRDAPAGSASARPLAPIEVKRDKSQLLLVDAAARRSPAFEALKAHVDGHLERPDRSSVENVALVYLLTSDKKYAQTAYGWAERLMTDDVRSGSYLGYGDHMRPVALVLDWCGPALSKAQRDKLAAYLDRWTHELWFDNQGSGWGLADPGNNYYAAFLEGTAFAARALAAQRHPHAGKYEALLRDKIEGERGLLAYLKERGAGGDWSEGANYGQRAKQRLGMALAALATTGGPNYFEKTTFFDEAISFAVYQLQPDRRSIHPSGDLARDTAMLASPYDRDYVQVFAHFSRSPRARSLARWYLEQVVPSYEGGSFSWPGGLHKDVLFGVEVAARAPDKLSLRTSDFVNLRSGWDERATSLTLSVPAVVDQSHAHHDAGSFTLFKGGWQALDAGSLSRSGLLWQAGAHNMVHVEGHERRGGRLGGVTRFVDAGAFAYAHYDATALYRKKDGELLDELTREIVYLRPDTVVVYDRVAPKSTATGYSWRLHFAAKPERSSELWKAAHGDGGIAVGLFDTGTVESRRDDDLESRAFRLQASPRDPARGRFLAVMRAGWGGAPDLEAQAIAGDGVAGVVVGEHVVVFSAAERGKAVALPFHYRFPGTDKRQHLLFDMEGKVDIDLVREGDSTRVTVRSGAAHAADAHGIVRF